MSNFLSIHFHTKRLYIHMFDIVDGKMIGRLLITLEIFQDKRKYSVWDLKCRYCVFTLWDRIIEMIVVRTKSLHTPTRGDIAIHLKKTEKYELLPYTQAGFSQVVLLLLLFGLGCFCNCYFFISVLFSPLTPSVRITLRPWP